MTVCLTDILFVLATLFLRHQHTNQTHESVWLVLVAKLMIRLLSLECE